MLLDRYVTFVQPLPSKTRTWMPSPSVVSELFTTFSVKVTVSPLVTIWLLGCRSMSRSGIPGYAELEPVALPTSPQRSVYVTMLLDVNKLGSTCSGSS